MYEQVAKAHEKKSQMEAHGVSQMQNNHAPTSRFVDNRPEAIQMRKLRDLAKISPQNAKLRELHHLATAHSVAQKKSDGKQGFGFVDKRHVVIAQRRLHTGTENELVAQLQSMSGKYTSQQQSILQLAGGNNAFLAGDGAYWHVHYDHVKFGNDNATRVNFGGRSAKEIRNKLNEVKDRPARSKPGYYTYMVCITWIDRNLR